MIGDTRTKFAASSPEPVASIVIVNYRSAHDLLECLDAIAKHTTPAHEVLVMDNDSSDGSVDQIGGVHPSVNIVDMGRNVGYGRAINAGAALAQAPVLVVLNPDVVVTDGWLEPLVSALESDPTIGGATPCVVLDDDPETINALGLDIHWTLLGFNRGLHRSVRQIGQDNVSVNGVQGGAFAVRKDVFMRVRGMNPAYFLYHEDVEFSLRLVLAGHRIVAVPSSVVHHKYELHMTPQKLHWLERHRWLTLVSTFHPLTLVALSPLLLLTEIMIFAYSLSRGSTYLRAKLSAVTWVAHSGDRTRRSRARMRAVRKRSDIELLSTLTVNYHLDQLLVLVLARFARKRDAARSTEDCVPDARGPIRQPADTHEGIG